MARKALYNIQSVLTQAADIFLEHGFNAANMDEIIARTGFNRRGFYLEFGSKKEFFYQVLKHYHQSHLAPLVERLSADNDIANLERFLTVYSQHVQGKGCLLINALAELGYEDARIRDLGRHFLDQLALGIMACVEKAQAANNLVHDSDAEVLTLLLTTQIQGLASLALITRDPEEIEQAVAAIVQQLR
jgi:TetR/AcrR family transcriptional repressor of nem operon